MHSIEAGASLDRGRDEDEMTPLGYAIETGNVKVVKALTAAGAGNLAVIKALIAAGAPLEAASEGDFTPLMYAIAKAPDLFGRKTCHTGGGYAAAQRNRP